MPEAEPVTMVDVFEIPREDVETFKAGWRERAALMSAQPGFREANGHTGMQTARQKVSDDPRQRVVANTGLYRAAVTVGPRAGQPGGAR